MLSTVKQENDPHDVVQIATEALLVSRAEKSAPTLAPEVAPQVEPAAATAPKAPEPRIDVAPRATVLDNIQIPNDRIQEQSGRSSLGRWAARAAMAFLLVGGSAVAAAGWDKYADTAKQVLADWTPHLALPSLLTGGDPRPAEEAGAVSTTGSVTPEAVATAAPETPASPEQTELLQSMARDVAAMSQQITELKSAIAQLKAGQDQISRDMTKQVASAKPVEPLPRPKPAVAPAPRATAMAAPPPVPVHRPKPAYAPPPAAFMPPPHAAPVQIAPTAAADAEDGPPVMRPPMPLR